MPAAARPLRVLHLLSQRPLLTGSGITLDALVRCAAEAGHEQRVVIGVPAGEAVPTVGGLPAAHLRPLFFGEPPLAFPVPGMSDVMPYPSTRFAAMTGDQVNTYCVAWRQHLATVISELQPQLIHSHHLWLLSAVVKDLPAAAGIPLVCHCHATGLRQMALCPHLAGQVRAGCRRAQAFVVLHDEHGHRLQEELQVAAEQVRTIGAGYRQDLFFAEAGPGPAAPPGPRLVYVGKYSSAKGLPWLLEAVQALRPRHPGLELHVAGGGAGTEAEQLRQQMTVMAPLVVQHGQLSQPALAQLLRRCQVCVLPSLYEGVPLVLVEALACGCRLVATRLPGVTAVLEPHLGPALDLVPLPRLRGVDQPHPADLPAFVAQLTATLDRALARPPLGDPLTSLPGALAPFTWAAVFQRLQRLWQGLVADPAGGQASQPPPTPARAGSR